jgi:TatA/E family protein of Tat protein translocase
MLAILDNLGFSELMIVVVVAVLIFGKRLPEVAAQAGAQLGKFRRSLQDIKNETNIDEDLRKIQRDIQNVVPRNLSMGEMARIASAELEKRMMANDERKEPAPGADAIQAAAAKSQSASTPAQTPASTPASTPSSTPASSPASNHASTPAAIPASIPASINGATETAPASDASQASAPSIAAAHETGTPTARKD